MIRLTDYDTGKSIYMPSEIVVTSNYKEELQIKNDLPEMEITNLDGSMIHWQNECFSVKESPEEVARKVLEYRLELERYKAAVRVGIEQDNLSGRQMAEGAMDILGELAGLEEQKDE